VVKVSRNAPERRSGAPNCEKKAFRGRSLPKIAPERTFRGPKFRSFFFNVSDLKQDCREYKETNGETILPGLRILINSINTLPVSTAECERGFSKLNILCSTRCLRSKLSVNHLSSLMFVSMCGPPVSQWEP